MTKQASYNNWLCTTKRLHTLWIPLDVGSGNILSFDIPAVEKSFLIEY